MYRPALWNVIKNLAFGEVFLLPIINNIEHVIINAYWTGYTTSGMIML
ncbi:hypothetical protein SDC9_98626 [bioreactor metagenome]|uniref:Uncharacterized protein n=1 Tax=bioreactor metagenome TaxID=1076179 RepID=A0A645AF90_9ZZZZ